MGGGGAAATRAAGSEAAGDAMTDFKIVPTSELIVALITDAQLRARGAVDEQVSAEARAAIAAEIDRRIPVPDPPTVQPAICPRCNNIGIENVPMDAFNPTGKRLCSCTAGRGAL
jgi:hypothetical protein